MSFLVVLAIIWSKKITYFKFSKTHPTECGVASTSAFFFFFKLNTDSFTFASLL